MTKYDETFKNVHVIFEKDNLTNTLGEVLSASGKKQIRIAETEKYAHVTFFFNGGREQPFEGETRILIPSPNVRTYDEKPEMSAYEVTDALVEALASDSYDFIVVNYANTDMVGHTGDLKAAAQAVEAVDRCLGRLKEAVTTANGVMLITADHGNAEMMLDESTHEPHTAHTLNKVPLVVYAPTHSIASVKHGRLADIAPTVLALMAIDKPEEMTGISLIG
jgi:2,3-bisphosphoglycerate-independent phosphoglycerate mutase